MRLSTPIAPRFARPTVPHSRIRARKELVAPLRAALDESQAARLAPITKRILDEIDERRKSRSKSKAQHQRQRQQQEEEKQAGGAGGATTWDALLRADRAWSGVKEAAAAAKRGKNASSSSSLSSPPPPPPPEFVTVRKAEKMKEVSGKEEETAPSFDVAVAGGTLGVILAAALASAGLRVAVVEAGPLRGREQEWNICREELDALVAAGALSEADAAAAVVAEFNPVRCAFSSSSPSKKGKIDDDDKSSVSVVTTDVLNLGVSPDKLIRGARRVVVGDDDEGGKGGKGGQVFEFWPLRNVSICDDGVVLFRKGEKEEGKESETITARLFIDCMGSGSPAARQARAVKAGGGGSPAIPDGVCMVAGTCSRGPWPNDDGDDGDDDDSDTSLSSPSPRPKADVIAAIDGAALGQGVSVPGQFFWESFPAGGSDEKDENDDDDVSDVDVDDNDGSNKKGQRRMMTKTTYMFQYSDLDRPDLRPSLVEFVEEYWKRVRAYQGLDSVSQGEEGEEGQEEQGLFVEKPPFVVERVLFGVFYTYRDSPLRAPSAWDRFLFAGDAAGLQSPLSFGGLGSLTRHVSRMRRAVAEALACDALSSSDLSLINSCYSPNLSGSWMLQRAMAARPESPPPYDDFVVDLLRANFNAMASLGDETLRPFLRDVVRLDGLSATLARQMLDRPDLVFSIVRHVGLPALLDWARHYAALVLYTALASFARGKEGAIDSCSLLDARGKFRLRRRVEALVYGSGLDWVYKEPKKVSSGEESEKKMK